MPAPRFQNFGKKPLKAGGILLDKYNYTGMRVINKTGSAIAADKLVAISGFDTTSGRPKIVLANADTALHSDIWVALSAIDDTEEGVVFKGGLSNANLDTSGVTTVGDPLYLSNTAGGFTTTEQQNHTFIVGWSVVKSSTVGQIYWHISPELQFGKDNGF